MILFWNLFLICFGTCVSFFLMFCSLVFWSSLVMILFIICWFVIPFVSVCVASLLELFLLMLCLNLFFRFIFWLFSDLFYNFVFELLFCLFVDCFLMFCFIPLWDSFDFESDSMRTRSNHDSIPDGVWCFSDLGLRTVSRRCFFAIY